MAHDIYAYGVVSSSTLYGIHGPFPDSGGYGEIRDVEYMAGGEATNSSIVLARLGARVKLDGNWIGDDANGVRTRALLSERDIDMSRLPPKDGYNGVQEVVFAAEATRTIFGTYGRLLEEAAWNMPVDSDIKEAKVVCLDPFFTEPAAYVGKVAFEANVPVVTVDCRVDNPLLGSAGAVVIAESFIRENYPDAELDELFEQYRDATQGLVVFTFGSREGWYARAGEAVRQFLPYPVEAVDTSGGGDAFRAGVVYGFLQGWPDESAIDFAAAVAAIVCTRFPGVMNAPSFEEVSRFMRAAKTRS